MVFENEVVISGVGGFFPKSHNMEQLKTALFSNEDLLESRWKEGERGVSNKIGKCPSIEYFDTAFFGIHRQQATFMDPMQRLMLERTFEALVDAGVNPQDIRGKRIGCYLGSSIGENDNLFYESIVSGFGVTGHSRAMMPNRISYWLNLKGPSCAYDSNWINGIEVLQMGFDAVREGHCEAAIIGTANLALNSELSWLYKDMGLLSDDGSTKAFDADASGYARSDGIIVMYIQRAVDAKRTYATIVGTSTLFNGYRDGTLLDLDQKSMVSFMKSFYDRVKVDPHDVEFLECYGCGIKKTDETELNAIDEVYCNNRKKPLLIGSVKTNAGHSEASANLISIAKVLIAMESGKIPATLQYSTPNPNIPGLVGGRMEVVTENRDWEPKYAAINGIGLSSSYAHCLLRANPKKKKQTETTLPTVVVASSRTETGIQELLDTIKSQPTFDPEYIALTQELFSKSIPGHLYRGYSVLEQQEEIKREFEYFPGNKRQTWFVFSGMGSQWCGMGVDLLKFPIAHESIMRCHKALEPHGVDLVNIITTDDKNIFDNILHSFVGIAAIQIALTDIMKALGVVPDGIIGHSVGELGCAYADGCVSAEQMMLCAYSRGRASLEATLIKGMMAAVGLGYQQIKDQLPESIEVACHNGADSCTLSGPTEDMEKFVKELQDKGIFARLVNVSNIAYHSRYIKPAAPLLLEYLKKIIPEPTTRSEKWISTSVPESNWDTAVAKTSSPEYHTNNLLGYVLFEEGSKHIPKDSVVIEIAPHGLLQAILKRSLKSGCTNIPLTQRGTKNGVHFLFGAIGKMYLAGLDVNIARIFPTIEYPVSRDTRGLAPLVHWEHGETWRTGLEDKLNYMVSVKDIQISLNSEEFRETVGHQLDERIILPLSSYLSILIKILNSNRPSEVTDLVFENIRFRNVITLPKIGSIPFYAMIQKGSGEFEILSGEEIIATGKVTIPQPTDKIMLKTYDIETTGGAIELSASDVYNEFSHRGHAYSGNYKAIKNLTLTEEGSLGVVPGNQEWQVYLEAMLQQMLFHSGEKYQNIVLPTIIQRINISFPAIPKEDEDIVTSFDYSTAITTMGGMQIYGITTTTLPTNPKPISYDALQFIPFERCICDSLESVLNYSMKLTLSNFTGDETNNIIITEIVYRHPSVLQHIKNVTEKYTSIDANVSSVTDPRVMNVSQTDPILIVSNDEIQAETLKSLSSPDVFALVKTTTSLSTIKDISTIVQFEVKENSYSLIRKTSTQANRIVKVKGDTLTAKDVSKDLTWVADMKIQISTLTDTENLYLVSNIIPTEGIHNFTQELSAYPEYKKLKYIFVLDKKAPEVSLKEPFYQKVFQRGTEVAVLKDGVFGVSVHAAIEFGNKLKNELQISSNVMDYKNLACLGINRNNETLHATDVGLGNIDYAATDKEDRKIMGLAKFDRDTYNLVPDPVLKWNVPENWSMEDACTIPHAYTIAYYCLFQKARLEAGETLLIHAGCNAIGLAAISIAASNGCSVYVTVATEWQRAFLKKQFTFLKDRNILSSENTTFEPKLLTATGGNGAEIILNCQTGSLMHASVRCLAEYGRFIQLGRLDKKQNNTIGMSVFLKNTCLMGVVPEYIFDSTEEDRQELHDFVQEGIDKFVVRPLHRKVVEHQAIGNILKDLQEDNHIGKILIKLNNNLAINQLNINKPNQYICDTRGSNLVYGGSGDLWIDMVEWLVLRGARKIIVTSEAKPQQTFIKRRLAVLQSYFKADIAFIPLKAHTKDSASELLSELYSLGPIQGVFILPNKNNSQRSSDIKSIQYIENALRTTAPKALFVNFQHVIAGICQIRTEAGFITYNIRLTEGLETNEIFSSLDDVICFRRNDILVKNDRVRDVDRETPQALYKKMTLLLPTSPQEIIQQANDAPTEPELVQLASSGPRRIRELPPLILVPGLYGIDHVRKFARELLYPIFYTDYPNTYVSIKDLAKIFAEKIKNLYPRGPYNIIGISWGGALAIEISKILQTFRNTQVSFIDGAPDTIQSALKFLGEGVNNEINLLNRVLNINNTDILKHLNTLPNWSARLTASLEHFKPDEEDDEQVLKESLSLLKRRLDEFMAYKPDDVLLQGDVFLIRPSGSSKYDYCGLSKYFTRQPEIHICNGDHLSMLLGEDIVEVINELVTVV